MLAKKILLMIMFSIVELLGGKDEGGDVLPVVLLRHLHAPLGLAPLLLGVVEDGGHVLAGTDRGRVVVVPEDVEQLLVAGDLGVPLELHGLGVVAEAPVGGALLSAAREPNTGPHDPRGTSKLCLGEPKSGHPEGCFQQFIRVHDLTNSCYEILDLSTTTHNTAS